MVLLQLQKAGSFFELIKPLDVKLITAINQQGGSPFFDMVFIHVRETMFWLPLYLFMFIFIVQNFRLRGAWWIVGFLLVVSLSDIISSHIIKENIFRLRPCRDESVAGSLRFFINYCPGSSSFTSSHATSHFAQATFFYLTLRKTTKWWSLAFLWAFMIAYGQVYVGVHYPFDVFCGAILGFIIGWSVSTLYNKQVGVLSIDK